MKHPGYSCSYMIDDKADFEDHNVKKHRLQDDVINAEIKNIFSCEQCEFDSEVSEELRKHNDRNIHDVINVNKSFKTKHKK